MTFDERIEEIIEIFWDGYENDFTEIHKRFVAGEITIEQQVEESEVVWGRQTKQAIAAIKQAMRETGPERLSKADVANFNTPEGYPEFSEEDWANGYNTAIDEIEKGFGL